MAKRRSEQSEHLAPRHLEEVASDCGISVSQLKKFIRLGPQAADELYTTMGILGVDIDRLKVAYRGTLRDMQILCSDCDVKKKCRSHLTKGTASIELHSYCANAGTFSLLPKI